jgi:hypothetical protein
MTVVMLLGVIAVPNNRFDSGLLIGAEASTTVNENWQITATNGVNVRASASANGTLRGALARNSVVRIDRRQTAGGFEWGRIASVVTRTSGSHGTISAGSWIALRNTSTGATFATRNSTNSSSSNSSSSSSLSNSTVTFTGGRSSGRLAQVNINGVNRGTISQAFGDLETNGRNNSVTTRLRGHLAIDVDFTGSNGAVRALMGGTVVYRNSSKNGANQWVVVLEHKIGNVTFHSVYAHLRDSGRPAVGTQVSVGQQIGNEYNNHAHIAFTQGSRPNSSVWGYFRDSNGHRQDFPTASQNKRFVDFDGRRWFDPIEVIRTNGEFVRQNSR